LNARTGQRDKAEIRRLKASYRIEEQCRNGDSQSQTPAIVFVLSLLL
jgi:hypothetical protein